MPTFVTFIYGDESYFKLGLKLLNKFKDFGYTTYVYTNEGDRFPNHNVIEYFENKFSYHHKILAIENLYKLGHEEILYLDSDLIVFNDSFFNEIKNINFNKGITYTRNGIPNNLESFLTNEKFYLYKKSLESHQIQNPSTVPSIWEDVLYFNFKNVDPTGFFKKYRELTELKHNFDASINSNRFGDQEGYTISIASYLTNLHTEINPKFTSILSFLRASNFTYGDTNIPTILSELDIIIPFRKDSDQRLENLKIVVDYYKKHFQNSNIIVSEQGTEQNVVIDNFDYVFRKKELPHNQSQCINDGVKISKRKYVCVIDCDIILLNYHNIYFALKEMFMDDIEYCLPYTECFDLPSFNLREPWGDKCVGGIFIINKERFIAEGMNDESFVGWGREDDERHHRLLNRGLKFKRMFGHIIHMAHPEQNDITKTSEENLKLLEKFTNDNSYTNKIQERKII